LCKWPGRCGAANGKAGLATEASAHASKVLERLENL
jgi:hypothetical protein